MASYSRETQNHDLPEGSRKVQVTILASEWGSSKGGLSTINRELAIQLAKCPEVDITFFLPKCNQEDKESALQHNVKILEATRKLGLEELEWLNFPPEELQIDVIVGHGVKLGHQAQAIKESKKCRWVQVVHTDPEELGMFKNYSNPISKGEEKHNIEVELCEMADLVVGVGSKLSEAFRSYLCGCQKVDKHVVDFTPGIFEEFIGVSQTMEERKHRCVLVFGRGDAEDFDLKGFDIAGKAVAALQDTTLCFVGAKDGEQEEIAERFKSCGVPAERLRIKKFVEDREKLKRIFQQVDLVVLPSRTEGFGLTGLEAMSAGLPVLVSRNSGFAEALSSVPFGLSFIVSAEDPTDWTAAIKKIWAKDKKTQLEEVKALRKSYDEKYNWAKQTKDLVHKMTSCIHDDISNVQRLSETTIDGTVPSSCQPSLSSTEDHAGFPFPTDIVEKIRQLYETREQRLLPVPWCEDFTFDLDEMFTKLKILTKEKTLGELTSEVTNMTAIFKKHAKCQRPRRVLIEGDPGMGKSTYCQKLAYDWAIKQEESDSSFPEIEVLLLLKCSEIKSDIWEAIDDQILPAEIDKEAKTRFFKFVRENQSKILLVLDGLDEMGPSNFQTIFDLVEGKELSDCYIVLTSRHEMGRKLRRYCHTLWEIVGFTKEAAKCFIRAYFKNINKQELAEILIAKIWGLDEPKDLDDLTKNPLNVTLLCILCEDFEGNFPTSRTQLYIEIVLCVLKRYERKQGLLKKAEDLMGEYKDDLMHLGRVALLSLQKGALSFEENEFGGNFSVLSKFGFCSLQEIGSKRKGLVRYAFLHKSFQEFFSGYYLACRILDGSFNCDSVVTEFGFKGELKQVFLFMIGILDCTSKRKAESLIESLAANINSVGHSDEDTARHFQFALDCILQSKSLAHTLGMYLKLTKLDLSKTYINHSRASSLSQALVANSSLTNLNLSMSALDDSGVASLSQALASNSSLTNLDLSCNVIGDVGAASLSQVLESNSSLTNLDLSRNDIGDSGAASFSQALESNSSLTNLDLRSNDIGDSGAASLFQALESNSSLSIVFDDSEEEENSDDLSE